MGGKYRLGLSFLNIAATTTECFLKIPLKNEILALEDHKITHSTLYFLVSLL